MLNPIAIHAQNLQDLRKFTFIEMSKYIVMHASFGFLSVVVTVIIFNDSINMECADLNNFYVDVLESLGLKPHLLSFFFQYELVVNKLY